MKAVVLLSGGLDSVVSMLLARRENQIELAITIDYGQLARENEISASKNICRHYSIKHKIISLPFMTELNSELIGDNKNSITNPWVPNRNGLFLNLGACLAESIGAQLLVCGFNREEAVQFPDNSLEFVTRLNQAFYYSTMNHVQAKSYVQEMDKVEIIKTGRELGVDFSCLWSCYHSGEKPCGLCSSCRKNIEAFKKAGIEYSENFIC